MPSSKLQTLVDDILPSTTAVLSYAIGSRKLSANEQFFVGAQTVVRLLQTSQIISDVCFITDHVAYTSSNKTKIVWIETLFFIFYFTWGECVSEFALALCCFYSHIQYLDLSEGADCVGGQLRRDKKNPFSGVTKSGRVWRKVLESDARSMAQQSSLKGREGAISVRLRERHRKRTCPVIILERTRKGHFTRSKIGAVLQATLGTFLRDRVEHIWAIVNWAVLNCTEKVHKDGCVWEGTCSVAWWLHQFVDF